ncbi:MAG: NlpC/P60 family protein [Pseudomonadota bacterium]
MTLLPRHLLAPALALLGFSGCATVGYRFPGPLGAVGKPRPDWVDEPEETSVWDDVEASQGAGEADESGSARAEEPRVSARERAKGEAVANAARRFLGAGSLRVAGETFRFDCSGLAMASYARVGLSLEGSSESMLALAREQGVYHRRRPLPGDVAFFENTYDANHNGRLDDGTTHVAVVVAVDPDGTVTMVHRGGHGIDTLVLNLDHPGDRSDERGKELNSYLRAQSRRDRPGTQYLAGELCVGFGSFWRQPGGG